MIEEIKKIIKELMYPSKSSDNDSCTLSDSVIVKFIKAGEIIEEREIEGHTWLSDGLIYVRDCIGESGSKIPVSSMSAWDDVGGENWKATSTIGIGDSPCTITWTSGWEASGALTVDAFKIGPGGGTIYSSISTSFIKPDGVSLDVYYTSTISSS